MLGAKIVWITLMETRSVRRWAACEWLLHSYIPAAPCSLMECAVQCASIYKYLGFRHLYIVLIFFHFVPCTTAWSDVCCAGWHSIMHSLMT